MPNNRTSVEWVAVSINQLQPHQLEICFGQPTTTSSAGGFGCALGRGSHLFNSASTGTTKMFWFRSASSHCCGKNGSGARSFVSLPRLQLNEQPLQHLIILVRQERRPQRLQHHWPTVSLLHHLQEDSVSDNRPSLLPLTRVDRILVGSTNISTTPESTPFTNIDDPLVPGSDNNTFCFTFVWCCYGYQCCTT